MTYNEGEVMLRLAASELQAPQSEMSSWEFLVFGCMLGVILAALAGSLWWLEDRDRMAGYSTTAPFPPIRSVGRMLRTLFMRVYLPFQMAGAIPAIIIFV